MSQRLKKGPGKKLQVVDLKFAGFLKKLIKRIRPWPNIFFIFRNICLAKAFMTLPQYFPKKLVSPS